MRYFRNLLLENFLTIIFEKFPWNYLGNQKIRHKELFFQKWCPPGHALVVISPSKIKSTRKRIGPFNGLNERPFRIVLLKCLVPTSFSRKSSSRMHYTVWYVIHTLFYCIHRCSRNFHLTTDRFLTSVRLVEIIYHQNRLSPLPTNQSTCCNMTLQCTVH